MEAHLGLAEAILFAGDPDKAIDLLQSHMKDEGADAWVISACAADIRSDTETMRVFTQKAWSMRQKAFVAPHRRIQLEALRCAASIYSGSPETGPGTLGVIGALMGKIAIDESEVLVQKPIDRHQELGSKCDSIGTISPAGFALYATC